MPRYSKKVEACFYKVVDLQTGESKRIPITSVHKQLTQQPHIIIPMDKNKLPKKIKIIIEE